jgi:hypothetical protein
MGRALLLQSPSGGLTEKVIILLTDGYHNTGTDPILAANGAVNDGITIHTVTYGWYADQLLMHQVAAITSGISLHAPDGLALVEAFQKLALVRRVVLAK